MGSVATGADGEAAYTGMLDVVRRTVKTEGVLGLYRGIAPTCAGIMPYAGFGFAGMEFFRGIAPKKEDGKLSVPWKLACGALAGWVERERAREIVCVLWFALLGALAVR